MLPRRAAPVFAAFAVLAMSGAARAQSELPPALVPPPAAGSVAQPHASPPAFAPPASEPVVVPDYAAAPFPARPTPGVPMERYNTRWMVIGILATTAGVGATITGALLSASAIGAYDVYCDTRFCGKQDDVPRRTTGTVLMVGGAVIGGIGFPLWLIGGRRVPVSKQASLRVSPTGASLRMSF